MWAKDIVDELLTEDFGGIGGMGRDEVGKFGEAIDDNEDTIETRRLW